MPVFVFGTGATTGCLLNSNQFNLFPQTDKKAQIYQIKAYMHWPLRQGRSYGGPGGHVPPTNSRCPPPRCPPTKKKSCIHIFNLPISRVCKYFAPHKNHAYAFLKYALKCLFVNGCSSPPILKEIALLLCKNARIF